ncbi:MAG: hypothetical protein HRU09_10270 [Oligoflexales bacterium]|nr:hypothetical protein [Oligoflexales bacterium]
MLRFEKCKYLTWTLFTILVGCGTIVGNPKKPVDDSTQTQNTYAIPEINIEMPEEDVNTDSASLLLTDQEADGGFSLSQRNIPKRKILLFSWVKRVNSVIREINRISRRVNQISNGQSPNDSGQIIFANQGEQGRLSGKLETISSDDSMSYQAVLCDNGEVFAHLMWSQDGRKVELTKDFKSQALNSTLRTDYKVRAVAEIVGDGVDLVINSQGTWVEELVEESQGTSLLEYGNVNFSADKNYAIKSVTHRYQGELGTQLDGDSFLTGRLVPNAANSDKYFSEFLAYLKSAESCGTFSQDSNVVWNPESIGDDGWCYGSPLGRNNFRNLATLQRTYTNLEAIGFASTDKLETVSFTEGLSCQ